jgi:hypothetical protein
VASTAVRENPATIRAQVRVADITIRRSGTRAVRKMRAVPGHVGACLTARRPQGLTSNDYLKAGVPPEWVTWPTASSGLPSDRRHSRRLTSTRCRSASVNGHHHNAWHGEPWYVTVDRGTWHAGPSLERVICPNLWNGFSVPCVRSGGGTGGARAAPRATRIAAPEPSPRPVGAEREG